MDRPTDTVGYRVLIYDLPTVFHRNIDTRDQFFPIDLLTAAHRGEKNKKRQEAHDGRRESERERASQKPFRNCEVKCNNGRESHVLNLYVSDIWPFSLTWSPFKNNNRENDRS